MILNGTGSNPSDIFVWKATISNPEAYQPSPWDFHIIATTIGEAVKVAEEKVAKEVDSGEMVTRVVMVGAYGVYLAEGITVTEK